MPHQATQNRTGMHASSHFSYLLLITVLLANFFVAGFQVSNPDQNFVIDEVGILKSETVDYLRLLNAQLEPSGAQIAVAIVSDLQGYDIETSANLTFRSWGVGDAQKQNGVLLLISMNERKIRIEVGYGLEGAIPDAVAGRIIRKDIQEAFRKGDYDAGVVAAIKSLSERISAEYKIDLSKIPPPTNRQSARRRRFAFRPILFIILLYTLIQRMRKGPRGGGNNGGGNALAQAVFWSLLTNNHRGGQSGFGGSGGYPGGGFGGGSSGGGGASGGW